MQNSSISPHENEIRYTPDSGKGHVESYFFRANHPTERKAIWLKATICASPDPDRGAKADAWCIYFDGDAGIVWGNRETIALDHAIFDTDKVPRQVEIGESQFELGPQGRSKGSMKNDKGSCRWDLSWQAEPGALGAPLSIFPSDRMVDGAFPKSKLLTPQPVLQYKGSIVFNAQTISIDGWLGMQGHNWGQEHAFEYAWGHCVFSDAQGRAHAMVEGFTGRIRIAGRVTPQMSALVVRRGNQTYKFNYLFDFWRQQAAVEGMSWSMTLRSQDGEANMSMVADPKEMVCLGYYNPDGHLAYCMNSKLARVRLRVNPFNDDAFECTSEHGGALEILRDAPAPHFKEVI